jgi:hypothetical protein
MQILKNIPRPSGTKTLLKLFTFLKNDKLELPLKFLIEKLLACLFS